MIEQLIAGAMALVAAYIVGWSRGHKRGKADGLREGIDEGWVECWLKLHNDEIERDKKRRAADGTFKAREAKP